MSVVSGVLCLDKPPGMSSFAAVTAARRQLGAAKAGHTGTLDPMATGVLPICFGEATKLARFLVGHEKVYRATVLLGSETDTQDATGRVVATGDPSRVTADEVQAAVAEHVGRIQQVVPIYSAVHQDGERLYKRARRGEEVTPPTREVEVRAIEVRELALPEVILEVTCGPGTYIRALATELGRRLGCRGHLAALRRLRVGSFRIEEARRLEELAPGAPLVAPAEAVANLPRVVLDAAGAEFLARSGLVPRAAAPTALGVYAVLGPDGALAAVAEVNDSGCRTLRVLCTPSCIPSRAAEVDSVPMDA